ncbi:hypothetical protein AT251_24130, partial [Enterovibrio nigricans]
MLIELHLPQGQTQRIQAIGRYLMLKEGKEVSVIVGETSVFLPRGYVFDMGTEFIALTVTNPSDVEDIALFTSVIPFVAGVDGSLLHIGADLKVSGVTVDFNGAQP